MSERYIFNKKLNRRRSRWTWLGGATIAMLLFQVFAEPVSAQEDTPLLDPYKAATNASATLTDIDFTRTGNDTAVTLITFDTTGAVPQLIESQGKLTVTLPGVTLAGDQLVELDVSQFGTAVSTIETFEDDEASRVELKYDGQVFARHSIEDTTLRIEIEPMSDEQIAELNQTSKYTGEPLSLDFQDVPVRKVLQIIAQVNGFNLVTTDTVSGNVTISLSGVPWDQALDMILKVKGLDKRLEGNILLIAPSEELAAREAQQLQSKKQVSDLTPLKSGSITVNYAKAANLATILKSSEGGILSERGSVTVDERTNTILVRDTQESIDEARAMVNSLDIPVKQVLIESRMVTVRDNADEQLGVRWGFSDRQDDNGVSGSLQGADTINSGIVPAIGDRLNVDLPVISPAGRIGFQVASLVDGTILDLELSALESENKGEIIASPRITVANQQEAYIEQGTEIPYVQATSSGATSVEFKKAVLSLKVTPHITPDNRIILDLVVTQDTRGETVSTSTGPAVAIDTQEIKTQVLVENGETVVLGGIFQQINTDDVTKVPLFGDLPVVGNLFKNTAKIYQKRELLIFVTPKIVAETL
ncbi:type IV pilus secretin PilQ family protein [Alteromonas sp. ASW11-19]|uniref:Type IV pilus secretin PilQ family protein n=1 Tax=Alteromonas salexigens TaxID=2982530 RepID=A0ABT2VJZ7_9ALTE|nr:type IV pilus secretin PilQ family protein [Alteromonas salexigens]MCU7553314.1 type IV pilus secretin PilQ family protein [Alteromonas salexigens]